MGNKITTSISPSISILKFSLPSHGGSSGLAQLLNEEFLPYHGGDSGGLGSLAKLPIDVLGGHILSKVDIATLCRCTAVSKQGLSSLLPNHLLSLSTALPPSIFLPAITTFWYGKILVFLAYKLKHYLIKMARKTTGSIMSPFSPNIFYSASFVVDLLKAWLHSPRISPSGRRFFRRLERLEFMELEVSPPPEP